MAEQNKRKQFKKSPENNIDYSQISNEEIKNYIRDIELRKEKDNLLNQRLREEDSKIEILNKNISKLVTANSSLEEQASVVRNSTAELSGEIAELKLELEKAEAESKLKRVKKIKGDILINAKILQDQEETIDRLRKKREEIRQQQEYQRNVLLEKREEIEKIKNQTVQNEFENLDEELVDIIQSTLTNSSDKTQIMSAALKEVSAEMQKIKAIDDLSASKTNENIELLKTQMLELNNIADPDIRKNPLNAIKSARSISSPKATIRGITAKQIEEKTNLINRLDKLVREGLITQEDKEIELRNFEYNNSLSSNELEFDDNLIKDKKKEREENLLKLKEKKLKKIDRLSNKSGWSKSYKLSNKKIIGIILLVILQLGIVAIIVLFALGIITI